MMAQYIKHETRHPMAGNWGRSMWKWHRLEWLVDGDGGATDGASVCDRYLSPPYLPEMPVSYVAMDLVCKQCLKAARS